MLIVNISPPKCGTTSLYHCLCKSRAVAIPKIKEPRFFAPKTRPETWDIPHALHMAGHYTADGKWFDDLFDPKDAGKHKIDFTTYYAVIPETPDLIANTQTDVRLILVLRDPVARFISHYYQYEKMGVQMPPIEQLIAQDSDLSRFLFSFADYPRVLARYQARFSDAQILMLDFADMAHAPDRIETQVRDFLGLADFTFAPSTQEKNVAGRARNQTLQRLIFSNVTKRLSHLVPASLKPRLLQVRKKIVRANTKAQPYPDLSPESLALLETRLADAIKFYKDTVTYTA